MKIKKYKTVRTTNFGFSHEILHGSKEKAVNSVKPSEYSETKYVGEVEIDLFCAHCDKDLNLGDDYIVVDEDQRYCSDCYEEETVTYYTVGGEHVGDENDILQYDDGDKETGEVIQ